MFFNLTSNSFTFLKTLTGILLLGLCISAQGIKAQETQLFADDFNLPDRTLITDWTAFGAIGREYWYIENQSLSTGNGNNYSVGLTWFTLTRTGTANWSDYSAGVDILQAEEIGVITVAFRWIDKLNYYFASIDVLKRPDTQELISQVTLNKVVDGRTVELSSTDSKLSQNIPDFTTGKNRIEVKAFGSSLSLLINGTVVLQATDSDHTGGTIALGQSYNTVLFDNVIVAGGTSSSASTNPQVVEQGYRVLMMDSQKKLNAEELKKELITAGFQSINFVTNPDGTVSVYVGEFATKAEADAEEVRLAGANFIPIYVEAYKPSGGLVNVRATPPPTPAPTPVVRTPVPTSTPASTSTVAEVLEQIDKQAQDAEGRGDYATANQLWAEYIAKAPTPDQREYGQKKRDAVIAKETGDRPNTNSNVPGIASETSGSGSNTLLYVGIGVGVLILVGGGAFFVMSKKSSASAKPVATTASMQPATAKPQSTAPKAVVSKPAATPAKPAVEMPQSETEAEKEADFQEVDSSARIRPGQVSRKKEPVSTAVDTEVDLKPESGSVSIGEIRTPGSKSDSEVNLQRNTPKPKVKTPGSDKTDSGLSLDFLFEEKKEAVSSSNSSSEFVIPPRPDSSAEVPKGQVVGKPDNADFFFIQNFENEKEGAMPNGWSGEYEYASLQVVRDDSSNGKCMRFEKKDGSGSALFSLNFPDAGGRIIVEFDIRCDDKNKYLLGFYIEKDGNFRQAITTIVHRTNSNSNPTLRLQNESTPYEFGQWTSVKYDLDLPRHLVDGYVDGKPVITAARLAQAPKLINTFSIRDNLATTGTLLIRNIRVYKG